MIAPKKLSKVDLASAVRVNYTPVPRPRTSPRPPVGSRVPAKPGATPGHKSGGEHHGGSRVTK